MQNFSSSPVVIHFRDTQPAVVKNSEDLHSCGDKNQQLTHLFIDKAIYGYEGKRSYPFLFRYRV